MLAFPFVFVSSAYVPVESMPGWMQPIAEHQPITPMVGSVRALALGDEADAVLGHSTGWFAVRALAWSVVIVAVFLPLATAASPAAELIQCFAASGVSGEPPPAEHSGSLGSGDVGGGGGELGVVQGGVGAAAGQQLGVVALLDDLAAVHHEDRVGVADRRQPVGDDEARAIRAQGGHRPLDQHFGARVDRGSSPRRG